MDLHENFLFIFFFNDTATTEIYTLSLHDALPISAAESPGEGRPTRHPACKCGYVRRWPMPTLGLSTYVRSEEHTSELQSHLNLVCRLLLEKKKNIILCK